MAELAVFAATPLSERPGLPAPAAAVNRRVDRRVDWHLKRLDATPATLAAAFDCLDNAERERARRFVSARDRDRYALARAWLRRLLGKRLGLPPQAVELAYGRHGKPELAPLPGAAPPSLHFNLSHSGDLAVCAFAAGREVGIDIERIWPAAGAAAAAAPLVERFFSPAERAAYRRLREEDKAEGFFNCWTRKEAYVKALGVGLALPLDSFDVTLAPSEPARLLRVGASGGTGKHCGWRLYSIRPATGFVGAIAVREPEGAWPFSPPPRFINDDDADAPFTVDD